MGQPRSGGCGSLGQLVAEVVFVRPGHIQAVLCGWLVVKSSDLLQLVNLTTQHPVSSLLLLQ